MEYYLAIKRIEALKNIIKKLRKKRNEVLIMLHSG